QLLREKPELYAILGRAVAKATAFAKANPEATIRLLWRDVPESRPSSNDEDRILRRDIAILKDRLALSSVESAPDPRWGAITLSEMASWQEFMIKTKAIKSRRDPQDYFSSDLVDDFNDFDAEKIT